ncbi:MAG: PIN domain-containing protein [Bacteroidota bacterium]
MIVADTSIWISFLRQDDQDTIDILRSYLKKNEVFSVSAVFGELYQGVKSNWEKDVINQIRENLPTINEENLFINAGLLSNDHRLYAKGVGLIDCYILVACLQNELALWTKDKKLQAAYEDILAT